MSKDRFLLIKAWSYVLWGDIDHVLGHLLIAEITDRIPVVYWPTHCLNNGFVQTNGFELYFEPINSYSIFDLAHPQYTYYPPIWDSDNLLVDDNTKDTWTFRNVGDILGSKANVVVGDVYYNVYELIPFIKKNHAAYGMSVEQVYHYLFNKYIRIKPDINMEIQGFYNSWLKDGHPALAVHVRRVNEELVFDTRDADKFDNQYWNKVYTKVKKESDRIDEKVVKYLKKGKHKEPNKAYHRDIQKLIEKYNIKRIFLLTDCQETLKEYIRIYGSRIVYTDCKRLSADQELTYMENPMVKRRRGIEVVKDAYIAAKCDFFIGNDFSHLSHAVTRMKDWPSRNMKLLYWVYRKRKYPINARLVVRKENVFLSFLKRLFGKRVPQEGGYFNAR
ncbi:O-fucosyltransferase family protein [Ruminiclostridium cellobioparum]|uniref:O-fucosyltransferase family protein n=1 Tax=Ruminiclostridium cellobioparum TaxID=29355 RepID=UPI0028A83E44|nr:O-fucosyltransferase family protein [Ruminiclostridium cellobioparum]